MIGPMIEQKRILATSIPGPASQALAGPQDGRRSPPA